MPRCVLTFRAKKGPVPTSDSRDWLAGSLLYIIGRVKYTNHATARPPPSLSLSGLGKTFLPLTCGGDLCVCVAWNLRGCETK